MYTPGPWKLILWGNEAYPFPLSIHAEDDSVWIARDGHISSLANAQLIAAAPELLEATREAADYLDLQIETGASFVNLRTGVDRASIVRVLHNVIAKAEGPL